MKSLNLYCIFLIAISAFTISPAFGQWEYGGRIISGGDWPIFTHNSCADDEGGILVAWQDFRELRNSDIYVQKVDSAGYEIWPYAGVLAAVSPAGQYAPSIAPNGYGGAIVGWWDIGRSQPNYYRPYVQQIGRDGYRVWPDTGIAISDAAGHQLLQAIVADGYGGAIALWTGPATAQRIDSDGNLLFGQSGLRMSELLSNQVWAWLTMSSDSNFIAVWNDGRDDEPGPGYYAQKFSIGGNILWDVDGVPVAVEPADPYSDRFEISPSPDGGFYAIWKNDASTPGIWMQWVDGQGDARWGPAGMVISGDFWGTDPQIAANYDGRAIIAWNADHENLCLMNIIDTTGTRNWEEDVILSESIFRVTGITQSLQGEFEIGIGRTDLECPDRIIKYNIEDGFVWEDSSVCFGLPFPHGFEIKMITDEVGGVVCSWKLWEDGDVVVNRVYPDGWVAPDTTTGIEDDIQQPEGITLFQNYPNPFNSTTIIRYRLDKKSDVIIEVFDLLGRLVIRDQLTAQNQGDHIYSLNMEGSPSGIYFVRLTTDQALSKVIRIVFSK